MPSHEDIRRRPSKEEQEFLARLEELIPIYTSWEEALAAGHPWHHRPTPPQPSEQDDQKNPDPR